MGDYLSSTNTASLLGIQSNTLTTPVAPSPSRGRKSVFASPSNTSGKGGEDPTKAMLRKIFRTYEEEQDKAEKEVASKLSGKASYWWANTDVDSLNIMVDGVMGLLILINAFFIGISMDYADGTAPWLAADIFFSTAFVAELVFKVCTNGFCKQFCGPHTKSNKVDSVLIAVDLVQLVISLGSPETDLFINASLFRVVRLVKLARLLRLVKARVFQDLVLMIQGILGGMATLGWAMLLFFMVIYVVSLLFRESLGNGDQEHVSEHFNSVPKSAFTTFRCAFGDCSAASGVPIFEHVVRGELGGLFGLMYGLFTFTITIGLFNVISAIFVESTLAATSSIMESRQRARLADETRLFSGVTTFIKLLLDEDPNCDYDGNLSDAVDLLYDVEFPASFIDELVQNDAVIAALDELDINPLDRSRLTDIFDPDNGGTIALVDIAAGIRKLRGEPRRSDIINVDLMIRWMQGTVREILDIVKEIPTKKG